ncbi:MAG: glycosyltransferase family 2 protein [Planctomycetaceae bacterium]|nr:glycosyltransferase family 2 protein [Planctomycetaceae bacterium]
MNSLSIVVPIYNEVENIPRLYAALTPVLEEMDREYEILLVDDGSTDGSREELAKLAQQDERIKVIEFRNNFGQTAAMAAGLRHASGDILITMDGDLQNDPTDIPMMVDKIEEGYDLVHGWRKNRQDTFINRKLPSIIANWLISKVTGFPVNDLGCTLKAIRREVAQELELFGDMHRFIPILAAWRGAKCAEVVTKHHPRQFGETKYGISRTFKVLLDLITVKYLIQYLVSPMRLFGTMGLIAGGVGVLSGVLTVGMKLYSGVDMTGNPLFTLTVFSVMVGIQFFILGMLGELGARIYFEVRKKQPYAIRHLKNFETKQEFPRAFDERRAA